MQIKSFVGLSFIVLSYACDAMDGQSLRRLPKTETPLRRQLMDCLFKRKIVAKRVIENTAQLFSQLSLLKDEQTYQQAIQQIRALVLQDPELLIVPVDGERFFPCLVRHYASAPWICELIGFLVEQGGACIDEWDAEGMSVLHRAVIADNCDLVFLLIVYGVNVNVRTRGNKMTPLQFACFKGNRDMFDLLLGAGADVFAIDSEKKNALRYLWLCPGEEDEAGIAVRRYMMGRLRSLGICDTAS